MTREKVTIVLKNEIINAAEKIKWIKQNWHLSRAFGGENWTVDGDLLSNTTIFRINLMWIYPHVDDYLVDLIDSSGEARNSSKLLKRINDSVQKNFHINSKK